MVGATPDNFQYYAGNLHVCNFQSDSGNFTMYNFQCGSGYFNLARNSAMFGISMQAATFPRNADYDMCREGHSQHDSISAEKCSEADITIELYYNVGDVISAVEFCDNGECACVGNFTDNVSSACDCELSMVGLTACDSFITLVAVLCKLAHDGLQFLARCTGMEMVIVAVTVTALVCGMVLFSFADEPLELW